MEKPTVIICVEGGVIQEIFSDHPVKIITLDYDTEGSESDNISEILGNDAFVSMWNNPLDPDQVAKVIEEIEPEMLVGEPS